ncbi:(2Fe-2S)-binding protein [Methylococcus sp. EFPC2]|uniref:(2Fe-2S)-binding protein n=1 Tax=Methylococcus sp. EFPC2 TaxID=2812648 RepID=UPI00196801D2|nr:(2Fe-2S)-binding protein [Methylococcus sp. EFPC2]QSA97635.1 (2Fe-2S)-binding protein [Methylococcus sp. EFPC2]
MNHTDPDRKKDIICRCSGTTTAQIMRLIDTGIDDLESISRATGACSGCGACDTDVLAFIADYLRATTGSPDERPHSHAER